MSYLFKRSDLTKGNFLGTCLQKGLPVVLLVCLMSGCEKPKEQESDIRFRWAGTVESRLLDEISGVQASHRHDDVLWAFNDDGEPRVHAFSTKGEDLGSFLIADAVNVDWEDMTLIPGVERDLLVLADIGDNKAERSRVWLYIAEEPDPGPDGRFSGEVPVFNWISVTYPDGPRDAESISWDPIRERLIILSKRDKPPQIYGLDGVIALSEREADLIPLGTLTSLRPPTETDERIFGSLTPHISQPTGMDISPDGKKATLITYRSLYIFELPPNGDWATALNGQPREILGPPRTNEEAVGFHKDGRGLWVTTEGERAPVYEFIFTDSTSDSSAAE